MEEDGIEAWRPPGGGRWGWGRGAYYHRKGVTTIQENKDQRQGRPGRAHPCWSWTYASSRFMVTMLNIIMSKTWMGESKMTNSGICSGRCLSACLDYSTDTQEGMLVRNSFRALRMSSTESSRNIGTWSTPCDTLG